MKEMEELKSFFPLPSFPPAENWRPNVLPCKRICTNLFSSSYFLASSSPSSRVFKGKPRGENEGNILIRGRKIANKDGAGGKLAQLAPVVPDTLSNR